MINLTTAISPNRRARIAGAFYLITIVMGLFAEVLVRNRLVLRDNAAATATNILMHESLFRFGLVADLAMLSSYIVVTIVFYELFRPLSRMLSLLAASFSVVGIAVLAVNCLNHAAPLIVLESAQSFSTLGASQLQALALISLRMHARGYNVAGVFFGIYCITIGYLVFRSHFLPRVLGALMAVGGASYVISSVATLALPSLVARLPDMTILGGIAELSLCLWLIVKGVDDQKWPKTADARPEGIQ